MTMADREKLIEVLEIGLDKIDRGSLPWAVEMLADHLIENGIYISKPCDAAPSKDWKFTNADRIRAKLENDEELAALYVRYNPDTHMYHTDAGAFTDFVAAMDAELEWLQQPAEGD